MTEPIKPKICVYWRGGFRGYLVRTEDGYFLVTEISTDMNPRYTSFKSFVENSTIGLSQDYISGKGPLSRVEISGQAYNDFGFAKSELPTDKHVSYSKLKEVIGDTLSLESIYTYIVNQP